MELEGCYSQNRPDVSGLITCTQRRDIHRRVVTERNLDASSLKIGGWWCRVPFHPVVLQTYHMNCPGPDGKESGCVLVEGWWYRLPFHPVVFQTYYMSSELPGPDGKELGCVLVEGWRLVVPLFFPPCRFPNLSHELPWSL